MRLRHNIAWMLAGQAVYVLCQWGKLIALARLGGAETVGQFALALAIAVPIMQFSGLQMRQMLVADAAGRHPFRDYLAIRLLTAALGWLGIAALAMVFGYRGEVAAVIMVIAAAKAFEGVSEVFYGLQQRHERLDLVAQSMMLKGIAGLAALVLGIQVFGTLLAGALAMATALAIILVLFDRAMATRMWGSSGLVGADLFRRERLKLAFVGLPLGMALLLVSLNVNMPRYFIDGYLGSRDLGSFAMMAYFATAGKMLIAALCQSASRRLANYFSRRDVSAFVGLLTKIVMASSLIGIVGIAATWLLGEEILLLAYGKDFALNSDLLVWIMIIGFFIYVASPFWGALTAMQIFRAQPVLLAIIVAVNASACALLVPAFGLQGAVWGWLAAAVCQLALALCMSWHGLRNAGSAAHPRPV